MFSLSIWIIPFAIAFPLLYLMARQVRSFAATINRTEQPREMIGAYTIIAAICGAVVGSMVGQPIDHLMDCHRIGITLGQCLFTFGQYP